MNTGLKIPSIFEAFNARALEPHQVAQTFVPSTHYATLLKQSHSLVVGPRVSGKTTLLKMLQLPALEAWSHPEAEEYRRKVAFSGVFIVTDVTWREQLRAVTTELDVDEARLVGTAAFTTHVLRSLVNAIEHRAGRLRTSVHVSPHRVELHGDLEASLVKEVAGNWRLTPTLPTLMSLRHSLGGRLINLFEMVSRETMLGKDGRRERLASISYLHLDFLQAASVIVEMFDDQTSQGRGRWALLFDELELAPTWILQKLIQSLRSVNDRFLFKLSMSPFSQESSELDSALSAMQGHDYDIIPLWYAHKEQSYPFCEALVQSMLSARFGDSLKPDEFLGSSEFETQVEDWSGAGTAYRSGTKVQRRFARMASRDKSFKKYLSERNIDVNALGASEGDVRAADIRKVTSIITVREAFRSEDDAKQWQRGARLRTRKNPDLYAGAKAVFDMSEGNPRWLKGIIGRLLIENPSGRRIPATKQGHEVLNAAHRFRAMLKTIPYQPSSANRTFRGFLSVLDRVGEHIFRAIVVDDFNPDPPGSFTVDSRTPPEMLESLGRALNAGAIVYVPDSNNDLMLTSLRGKRFRLSYLLAPYYRIPLILGKPTSLSSILLHQASTTLFEQDEQERKHE